MAHGPGLDYYLIRSASPGAVRSLDLGVDLGVDAVVVERFVLDGDHTAVGIDTVSWSPVEARWWSSADVSRRMRADPAVRGRVAPVGREQAEAALRALGGGPLPAEATLRGYFRDRLLLATAPPLRLNPVPVPTDPVPTDPVPLHPVPLHPVPLHPVPLDSAQKRVYRILFANGPDGSGLAALRETWAMAPGADATRVAGTARRHAGGDVYTWDLRRIGLGAAWSIDVSAHLGGGAGARADRVRSLLRELVATGRRHGMIPVTIERFA